MVRYKNIDICVWCKGLGLREILYEYGCLDLVFSEGYLWQHYYMGGNLYTIPQGPRISLVTKTFDLRLVFGSNLIQKTKSNMPDITMAL